MEEKSSGSNGGGGGKGSRSSLPSYEKTGERVRFTVEIRPEETTIVSWKKLLKDAVKVNGSTSVPVPPIHAAPALESRIAPGQPAENELQDEPAPHRFNAVIEKIERLYMGKNSSDEEDLDDVPDDDQYDTEDSFIDDAELDEYFQVDNSAIKHDGFFVNKGTLERLNKPTPLPNQQPKKRRRKDMAGANSENGDVHFPRKHMKVGNMTAQNSAPLDVSNISGASSRLVERTHHEDVNQLSTSKKYAETTANRDLSKPLKVNGGASELEGKLKDKEKQRTNAPQSKIIVNKVKDISGSSNASHHKYVDKNNSSHSTSQSDRSIQNFGEVDIIVRSRDKNDAHGQPHSSLSGGNHSMEEASNVPIKDGSTVRNKGSMLEKALRELERIVVQSKPSTTEVQDADTSSQAVKRRLPSEVKQKLAKVARLTAAHGKPSNELLERLMSILGGFMQLRTLKKNLKDMINMELSAKEEKHDRFRQVKKEVTEMIQMRRASQDYGQQTGESDDFQDSVSNEKGVPKPKFSMDDALQDKICDLYELYVHGLDEDTGPQYKKLYAELAGLWPNGAMDNHGIKSAICKAKGRKRAIINRQNEQEKIRNKKLIVPTLVDTAQSETSRALHPPYVPEKLTTDSSSHGLAASSKPVSSAALSSAQIPSSLNKGLNSDKLKPKKMKSNSGNSIGETRPADGVISKEKPKRKSDESNRTQLYTSTQTRPGEERQKSHKQVSGLPQSLNS